MSVPNDFNIKNIGIIKRRLKHLLSLYNVDPTKAAKRAELSPFYVRDILNNKSKKPRKENLEKLAKTFNTDVGYILGHHDNEPEPPPRELLSVDPFSTPEKLREAVESFLQGSLPKTTVLHGDASSGMARIADVFNSIPELGQALPGKYDEEHERALTLLQTKRKDLPQLDLGARELQFALALNGVKIEGADLNEGSETFAICELCKEPIRDGVTYAVVRRLSSGGSSAVEIALRRAAVAPRHITFTSVIDNCPPGARAIKVPRDQRAPDKPRIDPKQEKSVFVIGVYRRLLTNLPVSPRLPGG